MRLADLTARQIARAEVIYRAAKPWGADATKAALMTAAAESSFLLYANDGSTQRADVPPYWRTVAAQSMRFDHDAVAPRAQGKPAARGTRRLTVSGMSSSGPCSATAPWPT
jgi:hypothetical protein